LFEVLLPASYCRSVRKKLLSARRLWAKEQRADNDDWSFDQQRIVLPSGT